MIVQCYQCGAQGIGKNAQSLITAGWVKLVRQADNQVVAWFCCAITNAEEVIATVQAFGPGHVIIGRITEAA